MILTQIALKDLKALMATILICVILCNENIKINKEKKLFKF